MQCSTTTPFMQEPVQADHQLLVNASRQWTRATDCKRHKLGAACRCYPVALLHFIQYTSSSTGPVLSHLDYYSLFPSTIICCTKRLLLYLELSLSSCICNSTYTISYSWPIHFWLAYHLARIHSTFLHLATKHNLQARFLLSDEFHTQSPR